APAASAQRPERGRDRDTGTERERAGPQGRFSATGLKVGSAFPEIDVFNDQGGPFNTRSLKGKYTVVVNGCLT
ncbi:MAG: hypothetical protein GY953_04310, partial [bacterium]|nr:hypothetical protein [bacterium]